MGAKGSTSKADAPVGASGQAASGPSARDHLGQLDKHIDRLFQPVPVDDVHQVFKGGLPAADQATAPDALGPGEDALPPLQPNAPQSVEAPLGSVYRTQAFVEPGLADSYQWPSASPSAQRNYAAAGGSRLVPQYAADYYRTCDLPCRYCGALVYDGYQFCPHCGSAMTRIAGVDMFGAVDYSMIYPRAARALSPEYVPVVHREYVTDRAEAAALTYRHRTTTPPRRYAGQVLTSDDLAARVVPLERPASVRPQPAIPFAVRPSSMAPPPMASVVLPLPAPVAGFAPAPLPPPPTHQLVRKKYAVDEHGEIAELQRQAVATTALGCPSPVATTTMTLGPMSMPPMPLSSTTLVMA
mmetsp:Transcript_66991/g.160512  ORF Transcript_66991/g.160512 Transcript_66991/m.160512 type:complete len:355 (+) Transcript_66991:75-1139(+)